MKNKKNVRVGSWVMALVVVTVLTGCVEFVPELPPMAPPDLGNAPVDAEIRATGPVRQMVEPIRMNVEVVVDETRDVVWWRSLSDAEKAALRDAAAAQRKSIEAQLAMSGIVKLDPQLKVQSENEKKRKDGYCLRVKLQPWSNPQQGGQGWVHRDWVVIQAATGTPVREHGTRGLGLLYGAGYDSGRRAETVSIGGREVQKHFPASELEQIVARVLQDGHRLPVPSVTRTWANGRYVEVSLTDTETELRNHQIVTIYEQDRKSVGSPLDIPVGYGIVLTHEGDPSFRIEKEGRQGARAILEMYNPASGRVKIGQGVK